MVLKVMIYPRVNQSTKGLGNMITFKHDVMYGHGN